MSLPEILEFISSELKHYGELRPEIAEILVRNKAMSSIEACAASTGRGLDYDDLVRAVGRVGDADLAAWVTEHRAGFWAMLEEAHEHSNEAILEWCRSAEKIWGERECDLDVDMSVDKLELASEYNLTHHLLW